MAQVKCKICGTKIDKDSAYCVEKTTQTGKNAGKVTRNYYCSQEEYEEDRENKSLWKELLLLYDYILGYTCISKTKVNLIKEIEMHYSRKQLYNCLKINAEEIKTYLNEKDIYDEYGKLTYINACIKNKIQDFIKTSMSYKNVTQEPIDYIEETDEELLERITKEKNKRREDSLMDIIHKINNQKEGR